MTLCSCGLAVAGPSALDLWTAWFEPWIRGEPRDPIGCRTEVRHRSESGRVVQRSVALDEGVGQAPRTRFAYLDNLKALMIAGIIAAHAVMGYSTFGSWTYQDVQETTLSPVVEIVFVAAVMIGGGLFLMALFFLISGLLTEDSLARKGPSRFVSDRLVRLGIPFACTRWPCGPSSSTASTGPCCTLARTGCRSRTRTPSWTPVRCGSWVFCSGTRWRSWRGDERSRIPCTRPVSSGGAACSAWGCRGRVHVSGADRPLRRLEPAAEFTPVGLAGVRGSLRPRGCGGPTGLARQFQGSSRVAAGSRPSSERCAPALPCCPPSRSGCRTTLTSVGFV